MLVEKKTNEKYSLRSDTSMITPFSVSFHQTRKQIHEDAGELLRIQEKEKYYQGEKR